MSVYFVQAGESGPIKIGFASDIRRRLVAMQANHYEALHVLGSFRGTRVTERRVHRLLAEHRIRGEWFRDHPAVHAALANPPAGSLIEQARLDANLSREAMCRTLGISMRTWVRWEMEDPRRISALVVTAIAVVTGKPIEFFLGSEVAA